MNETTELLILFDFRFTPAQKREVHAQFERLAEAYPDKCHHNGGYADLWLCAIADVRDGGKGPWL